MRRIQYVTEAVMWPLASLTIAIAIWQSAVLVFHLDKVILPGPLDVLRGARNDFSDLSRQTCVTMVEAALGFLIGGGGAFLMAILFTYSRPIERSIYPYAIALKSTPLIAVAPLLVLWFGNGILSKVVMSAMVAFFPVLVSSVTGLGKVDPAMLDLMKSMSASWLQILVRIRIPNSLPVVFASLKIASSMSVVGAVIGEFTGATSGIGHLLTTASYYLDTSLVFAGVIFITVAGLIFFGLVAYVEKLVITW